MNKLIQTILQEIPNCSRITTNDRTLYERFIGSNSGNHYAKNWIFIEQIIQQNKGIKYFDPTRNHLLTIAPDWSEDIPNYIYLPLGENAINSVPYLAKKLKAKINTPIIVKKIYGISNINFLVNAGFKKNTADYDGIGDDQYPEIVVSTKNLINGSEKDSSLSNMRYFRRRYRKFICDLTSNSINVEVIPLSQDLHDDYLRLVNEWSIDYAHRYSTDIYNFQKVQQGVFSVYYPYFIKNLEAQTISFMIYLNKNPVAFMNAYHISPDCLAVNGSLSLTKHRGLIQFAYRTLALEAERIGYKCLNLGSNDNYHQDFYKSKMGVVKKTHVFSGTLI